MKLSCPLCNSQHIYAFHKDKRRDYYRCQPCALVFVDPLSLPDKSQELAEYQLHENTLEDDGYLAYLRRLFDCLAPHLRTDMSMLDYGSGPCPALAHLFQEAGFSMDCYDPFFGPKAIEKDQYDIITATESIEHFHSPAKEWAHWMRLLKPGGWLGIMTKRVLDVQRFANWHYKNDPTHVSFFSVETFSWLAKTHNLNVIFPANDIVLMQKPE